MPIGPDGLAGPCGDVAWLSHPRQGKHLFFNGDLLHGAPAELAEAPLADGKGRVTLLVNIWVDYVPGGLQPMAETGLGMFKGQRSSWSLQAGSGGPRLLGLGKAQVGLVDEVDVGLESARRSRWRCEEGRGASDPFRGVVQAVCSGGSGGDDDAQCMREGRQDTHEDRDRHEDRDSFVPRVRERQARHHGPRLREGRQDTHEDRGTNECGDGPGWLWYDHVGDGAWTGRGCRELRRRMGRDGRGKDVELVLWWPTRIRGDSLHAGSFLDRERDVGCIGAFGRYMAADMEGGSNMAGSCDYGRACGKRCRSGARCGENAGYDEATQGGKGEARKVGSLDASGDVLTSGHPCSMSDSDVGREAASVGAAWESGGTWHPPRVPPVCRGTRSEACAGRRMAGGRGDGRLLAEGRRGRAAPAAGGLQAARTGEQAGKGGAVVTARKGDAVDVIDSDVSVRATTVRAIFGRRLLMLMKRGTRSSE